MIGDVEVISYKESFVPLETSKGLFDEETSNYELDFEDVKGQRNFFFFFSLLCTIQKVNFLNMI